MYTAQKQKMYFITNNMRDESQWQGACLDFATKREALTWAAKEATNFVLCIRISKHGKPLLMLKG